MEGNIDNVKSKAKKLWIEDNLPNTGAGLAEWFSEGVRHEIEAITKEGGEQRHELISGKLCNELGVSTGIYEFIIADATRIIEDSSGRLITNNDEYSAYVVSQQANRIYVQIEAKGQLPLNIPGATLLIDDTALLRRLLEILEERSLGKGPSKPLAVLVFHPCEAKMKRVILPNLSSEILNEQKNAIECACGSSVTYIWGPPGTGKTFVIAHLIHSLIESGERILVCSHTNAAVNQALLESLDKVLKDSGLVEEGKIVRVGRVPDESEVPNEVQLKNIVEKRAASLTRQLQKSEELLKEIKAQEKNLEKQIKDREEIDQISENMCKLMNVLEERDSKEKELIRKFREVGLKVTKCRVNLNQAKVAWFFREFKCRRAKKAFDDVKEITRKIAQDIIELREKNRRLFNEFKISEEFYKDKLVAYPNLPSKEDLLEEWAEVEKRLDQSQEEIRDLNEKISLIENEIINNAMVIFGTLTKNYTESLFEDQHFNAVIIDEVSMA
ncbi:AAA family ATPase, partial [bacterium]|nr:AAA family ATPase [bacterium]